MMNTYQCKSDIISVNEKEKLLSEARNYKYVNYMPDEGPEAGLEFISTLNERNKNSIPIDTVKQFINRINPQCNFFIATFIKFASKANIYIHKDDHLGRSSSITWALQPSLENFSPVKYYNEDQTFNESVYYESNPLIISTRNWHSCENPYKEDRYTFQLCYYNNIEELAELDKKGELFKY